MMDAPQSLPSDNREVIRIYQGVRVRVRQNINRRLVGPDPNYIPYRAASKFDNERDEIWRVIKEYHGIRDVFDALGGYRKLEAHKEGILRELRSFFPRHYPVINTRVKEEEVHDSINDFMAAMPILVIEKIQCYHRINMTTTKKCLNAEIKYLVNNVSSMRLGTFTPSCISDITGKRRGRHSSNVDLKLKPSTRITLKNIGTLHNYLRLTLY